MHEPDVAVIRAAGRGDLAAFEELVRAYQPEVWRFLRHLVRDPSQAEDLTQETFIRVYRNIAGFRFRSKFSTWVLQVARNVAIDALRARDRRRALLEVLPAPAAQPDGSVGVEINHALAALPLPQRESFLLVEVLGLTYREAALAVGVAEGTVKSRVFHARRQLVSWLAATEGGAAGAL